MDECLVRYKDVAFSQEGAAVLEGVDLQLSKGQFVYLTGRVGAGKSSLLKTMYAELDIDSGEAEVLGFNLRRLKRRSIALLRRKLGIVFQDFQLLTDRTVHDNLEFVLRATGWSGRKDIDGRISVALRLVGLEDKARKMPHELSGGEQQRVVIARAMLNAPELILADEPTGNLDPDTSRSIMKLLHDISRTGALVIMATHNMQLIDEFPGDVYRCADHRLVKVSAADEA